MGLKSAPTGVKAQLRSRFPKCFREFGSLAEARDAIRLTRAQTVVSTDGNVLMMGVPQSCNTFDSYVNLVTSILRTALATSCVLVVVFDEMEHMTEAKLEEQSRRDAAKRSTKVVCSSDLSNEPTGDDYTQQYIDNSSDVHALVRNRQTRGRFFDSVCLEVLARLRIQIQKWNAAGHLAGTIVFDGIDPRGGDRPVSEPRSPQVVASDDSIVELFSREAPIGEGDMKLEHVGKCVRANSGEGERFEGVRVHMVNTIDTDSFAIELLSDARRRVDGDDSAISTLIAMRERATKRGTDDEKPATFLCCDVTLLNQSLQKDMFGLNRNPSPIEQHSALTLMIGGWALCGSDFVEVKGMRSDVVFDAIREIVKLHDDVVNVMRSTLEGDREAAPLLCKSFKLLLAACACRLSDMPRIKRGTAEAVRRADDAALMRAAWVACYWNGYEIKGDLGEFGFVRPFAP